MTNSMQNTVTCTSGVHVKRTLLSLKDEAEAEQLDRQAGHDYVPMDVFVDPGTMKEHFQASSISSRWH